MVPGINSPSMRLPVFCFVVVCLLASVRGAEPQGQGEGRKAKGDGATTEPFFKKGDVIALVGGEDMVVASEYGYLEMFLVGALPDYQLRFRDLAREGDTVFEQPRDLNFPTWEEQFDKIGATVVICQFGKMEGLAGKEKLPEFIAAYEKLVERLQGGGKRRVVLLAPSRLAKWNSTTGLNAEPDPAGYGKAIEDLAIGAKITWIPALGLASIHDGGHLTAADQFREAFQTSVKLAAFKPVALASRRPLGGDSDMGGIVQINSSGAITDSPSHQQLHSAIVAKNKLWFNYWRVQNWAFLAGDRTNQPSSRDWRDPSKRWFPAEHEEFLPLIEAKEKEIDALAAKLAGK